LVVAEHQFLHWAKLAADGSMIFMTRLWRYWGFVAVIVGAALWAGGAIQWTVALIILGATVPFWLFQVPTWCMAITRGQEHCRDNANGLLGTCHRRQHKWQKFKLGFYATGWGRLTKDLWTEPKVALQTIGLLISITGGSIGVISAVVKM
jgi:hypothetical protein